LGFESLRVATQLAEEGSLRGRDIVVKAVRATS